MGICPTSTDRECGEAVSLAEALLRTIAEEPAAYQMIAAQTLIGRGAATAPGGWNLTFKRRELVPQSREEPIGAGGELTIHVDLTAGRAWFVGRGD